MELYQLRTFRMVAEEGHLTRAARRLHASQPAVSAHIKNLEHELGISLFQRTPKGMILTTDGLKLKEHADRVLATIYDMETEAKNLRKTISGDLRIGIHSEPDALRIPELFSIFNYQYPNLHLHLLQSMTGEVLNKLEDGALDAGFMYGENESPLICTIPLHQLRLVVAGPVSWQERLSSATAVDLGKFPWIMTPADCPFHAITANFFKKYSLRPREVAIIDQESTIRTMIKAEVGLSLLLEQDINRDRDALATWNLEHLNLQLSIACLDKRRNEPMLQTLLSVLAGIWSNDDLAD